MAWVQLKVGLALIHTRLQPGVAELETRISFNLSTVSRNAIANWAAYTNARNR
jgi:hypothetical protein